MTKNLERLVLVALVLWVASFVADPAILFIATKLGGHKAAMPLTAMDVMPITIKAIIGELVRIGVGIWLFMQAKRDGNSRYLWALFGLVFSLTAVVLYLLVQLLDEIRQRRKTESADNGADPIR